MVLTTSHGGRESSNNDLDNEISGENINGYCSYEIFFRKEQEHDKMLATAILVGSGFGPGKFTFNLRLS